MKTKIILILGTIANIAFSLAFDLPELAAFFVIVLILIFSLKLNPKSKI